MSIENIIISLLAVPVLWLGAFAMYMGWNKGVLVRDADSSSAAICSVRFARWFRLP